MCGRWDRRTLVAAGIGGVSATLAGCTGPGDPEYRVDAETTSEPESGTPVVDRTNGCLDGAAVVKTMIRRVESEGVVSKVLTAAEYERVNETIRGCPHPPDGDAPGLVQGMYVRTDSTVVRVWTTETRPG